MTFGLVSEWQNPKAVNKSSRQYERMLPTQAHVYFLKSTSDRARHSITFAAHWITCEACHNYKSRARRRELRWSNLPRLSASMVRIESWSLLQRTETNIFSRPHACSFSGRHPGKYTPPTTCVSQLGSADKPGVISSPKRSLPKSRHKSR